MRIVFIRFNFSDGEVDRASVSVALDFGFDSESGQTNHFNIDIHSFFAWPLALKEQFGVQQLQQP